MPPENTEQRRQERLNCRGIVMFRVLSDEINCTYCADSSFIRGMAQAVDMSDDGLKMKMIDMVGLSDMLHGFSFDKLKGTHIELGRPDSGKIVHAEIKHISGSDIGVRYLESFDSES